MIGFLVGYQWTNIYRIYHPTTKKLKVSRDVIFAENQFIGTRQVRKDEPEDHGLEMESGFSDEMDMEIQIGENSKNHDGSEATQNETHAPITPDEIVIQPPPSKPPNWDSHRLIARAFKAMLKGNWKWPRNYREAMETEDAKQWEQAMKKELESIMKNETWTLVPGPQDADVVKSHWVLCTKDNGMYKA